MAKKRIEIYDLICWIGKGVGGMALFVVTTSIILLFIMWVNEVLIPAASSVVA